MNDRTERFAPKDFCLLIYAAITVLLFAYVGFAAGSGEFDRNFSPTILEGAVATVRASVVQPDGKTIVVGTFLKVNRQQVNHVARFNSDGTLDATFDAGGAVVRGFFGDVNVVALQPDGKIIIGGKFETVARQSRYGLARLNADGSFDAAFVGTTYSSSVFAVAAQANGKIYVGGAFNTVGGQTQKNLARLNADGTRDASFASADSLSFVKKIQTQSDGRVIYAGEGNAIYRSNTDGTRDTAFGTRSRIFTNAYTFAVLPDDRISVGGGDMQISVPSNQEVRNFVQLAADGTLDDAVNPYVAYSFGSSLNPAIPGVIVQPDGKILYSDAFFEVNRAARRNIVRLNADGSTDATFNLPGGLIASSSRVLAIALQPDGKILYSSLRSSGATDLAVGRLNSDGSSDTTFARVDFGSFGAVTGFGIQPNGKILVKGGFATVNGQAREGVARLNADGSLDSFNPAASGFGTSNFPGDFLVQPDGKFLLLGSVGTGSSQRQTVGRFNADGSIDAGFTMPQIYAPLLALQPDGKIILGGSRVTRLNANGTIDDSFTSPGFSVNINQAGSVLSAAVMSNGKILVGGTFAFLNLTLGGGIPRSGFARLNTDGSLDSTYGILGGASASAAATRRSPASFCSRTETL